MKGLRSLLLVVLWLAVVSAGDTTNVILLDELPGGVSLDSSIPLVIRTNFSGTVDFVESKTFKVLVNVTSSNVDEAFSVETDLEKHDGALLLQVYKKPPSAIPFSIKWMIIGILSISGFVMLTSTVVAIWCYCSNGHKYSIIQQHPDYYNRSQVSYRSRASVQTSTQHVDNLGQLPEEDEEEKDPNDTTTTSPGTEKSLPQEKEKEGLKEKIEESSQVFIDNKLGYDDKKYSVEFMDSSSTKLGDSSYENAMEYSDQSDDGNGGKLSLKKKSAIKNPGKVFLPEGKDCNSSEKLELRTFQSLDDGRKNGLNLDLNKNDNGVSKNNLLSVEKETSISPRDFQESSKKTKSQERTVLSSNSEKEQPLLVTAQVHCTDTKTPDDKALTKNDSERGKTTADPFNIALSSFRSPVKSSQPIIHRPKSKDSAFNGKELQLTNPESSCAKLQLSYPECTYSSLYEQPSNYRKQDTISVDDMQLLSENERVSSLYDSGDLFEKGIDPHTYFKIEDSDMEILGIDSEQGAACDTNYVEPPSPTFWESQSLNNLSNNLSPGNPRKQNAPKITNIEASQSIRSVDSGVSSDLQYNRQSEDETGRQENPSRIESPKQNNMTYGFPPPPRVFSPSMEKSWNFRGVPSTGEYVQFEKTAPDNSEMGRKNVNTGSVGGPRSPAGMKHMHLAIVSSLCLLSIFTGVYCQITESETKAHITIFLPKSFLTYNTTVYYPVDGELYSSNKIKHVVDYFESPDPILRLKNLILCEHHMCVQGCDDNTGMCICRKGYRMNPMTGECMDVNECMEGRAKCHPAAGCLNTRGSYICICTGDFYGDGKSCSECSASCGKGMYQAQPCPQKMCEACKKSCRSEFYIETACTETEDADCTFCSPMCTNTDFESTKCEKLQDRICEDKSALPDPESTDNVIFEDMGKTTEEKYEMKFQDPSDFEGSHRFTFQRGSSLFVEVTVSKVQPVHNFEPVDHSGTILKADIGLFKNLSSLCPYPVPDYYKLTYQKLQNMVYESADNVVPCETYKPFGNFPDYSQMENKPIVCATPGPLSELFGVDDELADVKTFWAETSKRCARKHSSCENCTSQCARYMTASSSECSVIGDENDNGWSPRLQVCFSCCAQANCTADCAHYQHRRCEPKRCQQGNLQVFHLMPVYKNQDKFYCHITPKPNQTLIDLDFTISYHHNILHHENVKLTGGEKWTKRGFATHSGKILNITVNSRLTDVPDFIEGDILTRSYKSGHYVNYGPPLKSFFNNSEPLTFRPRSPFEVNPHQFSRHSCQSNPLNDVIDTWTSGSLFQYNTDLMVLLEASGYYLVTNKTVSPTIIVELPRHKSLLAAIFPSGLMKHGSLKGTVVHETYRWIVSIEGELTECPGLLKVNISDAAYFPRTIYEVDVVVRCPEKFTLVFYIPSKDLPGTERKFIATVCDNKTITHLNLHSGAKSDIDPEQDDEGYEPDGIDRVAALTSRTEKLSTPNGWHVRFSVPVLASICGGVVLLLFMVSFGMAMKPGIPTTEMAGNHCRHLVILVFYITFQCLYATVISMTVFMFILIAVNSETVSSLKEYHQLSTLRSTIVNIEMGKMNHHLKVELSRQNNIANHTKAVCQQDMKHLADDMKKLHESLSMKAEDMLDRHNIMALFNLHTQRVMDQVKMDLLDFRNKYQQYSHHTLRKIGLDVKKMYASIEENRWLAGARFLHGTVNNLRTLLKYTLKDFMEWGHLKYDLTQLTVESTLPLPKLPNLDDLLPEKPIKKRTNARNTLPAEGQDNIDDFHIKDIWLYPSMPYVDGKTPSLEELENMNGKSRRSRGRSTRNHYVEGDDEFFSSGHTKPEPTREVSKESESVFSQKYFAFFFGLMLTVDFIRYLHIMIKSVGVCRLLFFGYPIYVDCRERTGEGPSVISVASSSRSKPPKEHCWVSFSAVCKMFISKVMLQTSFIPKAAGTVIVCLVIYLTHTATERYLNRQTITRLGLYDNMEHLLVLNEKITNHRIVAHAEQINVLEYPTQEILMTSYIKRHQYILHTHQNQSGHMIDSQSAVYCDYLKRMEIEAQCIRSNFKESTSVHVKLSGCQFPNVVPNIYIRNGTDFTKILDKQMDSFLLNVQQVIIDVCYVLFIFLSAIVLKELLGMAVWLYMKRSGVIKLRLVYETDAEPVSKEK